MNTVISHHSEYLPEPVGKVVHCVTCTAHEGDKRYAYSIAVQPNMPVFHLNMIERMAREHAVNGLLSA